MKKLMMMATVAAIAASANVNAFDPAAKYQQACGVCHGMGVAGAPKAFDKAAWEPRLAKGMDTLVTSVTNGLNAMPPRGMCMDCTAEQYKELITYMSTPK
ncbi:MAG: cytochrome c5 family protein [Oceanospirillaceae bacterium]|uniref:c-type cytochrome n=1 Tax=unclassified Thalassolituus TaxID=2624967 RepID=UPI000C093B3E|nr:MULTISPECIES: c-type cytochrome [unclassified Thalassolituus]MAK92447.1 cytochrome c5 family protein [Thalassolituus sp.]MAY01223.1 cytochrome c5 family protein [Oceanospirillaceae bacterium]MBL33341.1 cytochrome c5 family protein [Oceanospirillaceae bacterium]MBS55059.1 cytochrome c5 family protein [Oceanospirillaceae bacterium]|tara:strand:+ start:909 stop:1208 length:300 start_codon:yes stop_codon:yes gene_type:complete